MDSYITCPHCGAEYTPGEIFIPKVLLGDPEYVKRDVEGKIQFVAGKYMDLTEEYSCDFCNKRFKVRADISFNTSPYSDVDDSTLSIPYTKRFNIKEF